MFLRIACSLALLAVAACSEEKPASDRGTDTLGPPQSSRATRPAGGAAGTDVRDTGVATRDRGTVTGSAPGVSGGGGQVLHALPSPAIAAYQGQQFSSGPVSILLRADQTFEVRSNSTDQAVEGRYSYHGGVISLTDARGDVGGARFPMRCRLQTTSNGFQLTDADGNCDYFRDLNFRR